MGVIESEGAPVDFWLFTKVKAQLENRHLKYLNTNLVLELLTELQRDGEEYQRVIEPGHDTLDLVNMADLKSVVVELTGTGHVQKILLFTLPLESVNINMLYPTCEMQQHLQHGSRIVQHWASSMLEILEIQNNPFIIWCTVYTCST